MDILRNITDLLQKTEITEMNLQETKGRDKSVLAKITKFPHQTGFHQNVSKFGIPVNFYFINLTKIYLYIKNLLFEAVINK